MCWFLNIFRTICTTKSMPALHFFIATSLFVVFSGLFLFFLLARVWKKMCLPFFSHECAMKFEERLQFKRWHMFILCSASAITRRTDEIAEDIEAQLLERIDESSKYTMQVTSLLMLATRQQMLVFVWYTFQEDVPEDMLCALLFPTNITAAEPFKSLSDYISLHDWVVGSILSRGMYGR